MTYNQKLEAHLADAKEYADKYFAITAFGSMNYGLDDENSDFDTKMIVLPSLKDICLAKSPISTTIIRDNNEHIEVRDLRLFDKSWRKQGLSALELLFSPYFRTSNYLFWGSYVWHREEIAHINPYSLAKYVGGVARTEFKNMTHATPARQAIIDKYGYDGKCVSHLIRLEDLLDRYLKEWSMEECFIPTHRDLLMDYKHQLPTAEDALNDAKTSLAAINTLVASVKPTDDDARAIAYLNDMLYIILKENFKNENANHSNS